VNEPVQARYRVLMTTAASKGAGGGRAAGLETSLGRALVNLMAAADGGQVSDDVTESVRLLCREGARLLAGTDCAICSIRPSERSFDVISASGDIAPLLEATSWPKRGSLVQRAVETRAPVVITEAAAEHVMGEAFRATGIGSVRAVPLIPAGGAQPPTAIGVYLAMRHGSADFTDEECALIDTYARLVALALMRAEQRIDDESRAVRLALGVDVALELAAAVGPEEVTHRILVRTADAIDADRATLLRLDGDDLVVEDTVDVEGQASQNGFRTPLRQQPQFVRALTTRRAEQGGALRLSRFPEDLRRALASVQHSLVLPLLLSGDVAGFLQVHRRREPAFSDADIMTLQLVGSVAVLALRNARLYADAQSARQSMSEFLDVVVHELRSPLTVVGGYFNMMREGVFGDAPQEWARPLEIVENKVREAQRMVDELLLAARLETGEIPCHEEELDLAEVVQAAVARAQPRAHLNNAELVVVPGGSGHALGDIAHVARILDNLINNALVYGGDPAHVEVAALNGAARGIAVSDRGPGVPAEHRERIFERFFRGQEGVHGSGLGLYVSRRLAEACRGSLELELAVEDTGSRFVLRLPVA